MAQNRLILERFEPLGKAGSGGFATVYIAWDPRIQRKVAIKTIQLSESDAARAKLPGADASFGLSRMGFASLGTFPSPVHRYSENLIARRAIKFWDAKCAPGFYPLWYAECAAHAGLLCSHLL